MENRILLIIILLFAFSCKKTTTISNKDTYYYVFKIEILKSGNMQGKQLQVALVRPDPSYRGDIEYNQFTNCEGCNYLVNESKSIFVNDLGEAGFGYKDDLNLEVGKSTILETKSGSFGSLFSSANKMRVNGLGESWKSDFVAPKIKITLQKKCPAKLHKIDDDSYTMKAKGMISLPTSVHNYWVEMPIPSCYDEEDRQFELNLTASEKQLAFKNKQLQYQKERYEGFEQKALAAGQGQKESLPKSSDILQRVSERLGPYYATLMKAALLDNIEVVYKCSSTKSRSPHGGESCTGMQHLVIATYLNQHVEPITATYIHAEELYKIVRRIASTDAGDIQIVFAPEVLTYYSEQAIYEQIKFFIEFIVKNTSDGTHPPGVYLPSLTPI
jgi:hypothetical protein